MTQPIGGVTADLTLTGNFEIDLNIVMAHRLSTNEQSIQIKLTAMKAQTASMGELNNAGLLISRLAASMQSSKPDDKIENPTKEQAVMRSDILKFCESSGMSVESLFGKADITDVTHTQMTTAASSLRQKADSIGSTSQTEQLMMQQAMSKLSQIVDQWSNMMSKIAQAKQTPISNMR